MDQVAGVFALVTVLLIFYVVMLRIQIRSIRRQLALRQHEGARQPLSLQLLDDELNRLAADVNRCFMAEYNAALESMRHEKQFKELVMGISHDLRTPLTALMGNLQLLECGELDAQQRERLSVIRRQANELSDLVEHFWEYAYYSIAEPELLTERVNLTNLVSECIANAVPQFEERALSVVFDPLTPALVYCDRECTQRIVQNLLRNCILHAAGTIRVTLDALPNQVVLCIRNPIAPDIGLDDTRIFDRFYSVDPSRGRAAGLGLAIVKLLACRMGGDACAAARDDILEIRVYLPHY